MKDESRPNPKAEADSKKALASYLTEKGTSRAQLSPDTACPDCGATPVARVVTHAETCPISVGVDRITAADARYFARNAKRRKRARPITWAEQAEAEMSCGWRPTGDVTVWQLQPGSRIRHFTEGGDPR